MQKNPVKGYLYTWNFVDGFSGLPRRKIHLKDTKPTLLQVAYLGDGERWDNKGTPSGAILCLILTASARRQQSAKNYHKYYGNYNIKELGRVFDAKTEELSGGGCAWWSIEFNSQDWSREKVDEIITEVLKWHYEKIKRIKTIEDNPY